MKRTFSTLIASLLIFCLCAGMTAHAQEPADAFEPGRGGGGKIQRTYQRFQGKLKAWRNQMLPVNMSR